MTERPADPGPSAPAPPAAPPAVPAPRPGPAAGPGPAPGPARGREPAGAPAPEDPRWRVEHLPLLTAVSAALLLCAASAGFLASGPVAALGAAAGVGLVTVGFTLTILVVAWADTVRPALVLPLGMAAYVLKYTLFGLIAAGVLASGWPGRVAMGWGIVGGAVGWTAAQAWWTTHRHPTKR